MRVRPAVLVVSVLALLLPIAFAEPDESPAEETSFARVVRPFLRTHCVACHAGATPQGNLDLARFETSAEVETEARLWRRILARVERGEMPPLGRPRPEVGEIERFLTWIAARLPAREPGPASAGRVTARRLNRFEYENTIRDLLGVEFRADETFPADDVGHGFDNVGDVLALPPVLLEKYLLAAETIAARAVVDEGDDAPPSRRYAGRSLKVTGGGRYPGSGAWILYAPAELHATHAFPRDGRYRIQARAFGQQAGPEPARMAFVVDGRKVEVVDVAAEHDAPVVYETVATVRGGAHRVGAAFVNDYYQPKDPDPTQRDRNLAVFHLEIEGPLDSLRLPPHQRRFVPSPPPAGDDREDLRRVLASFLPRAWRRPVETEEIERLLHVVETSTPDGTRFEARVRAALTAVLVSPHFLFRWEPDSALAVHRRPLTAHELATRLAYFLWSSTPDDRLLALADAGRLADDAVLEGEVARMLREARATALAEGFAAQWLKIRTIAAARPDPDLFPGVDEGLLLAMRAETLAFFEAILREGRDVRELLTADFTFANERLAAHYGLPGVRGPHLRRVPLPGTSRRGLLGHASVLTATSNPDRTSPVKRGKWILETLLDQPPLPPPPDAGALDETKGTLDAASVREQLALHRADPRCAACHDAMDPLGFALEHFDAVGRWREQDGDVTIDASGMLPDGRVLESAEDLAALLASEHAFLRSLSRHLLVYALGRGLVDEDAPHVDRLVEDLLEEPTLPRLVWSIVQSPTFRHRTLAAPENPAESNR